MRLLTDTLVWGIFPEENGYLLGLYGPTGVPRRLRTKSVILAPGAYDRPYPFPGWAIPVPFTTDNRPLLGPVEALDGLLVATGLKSTIILTLLVGELVAAMITGRPADPRLAEFSPSRQFSPSVGPPE